MTRLANPSPDAHYLDGAECLKETDKALLVTADDLDQETWIPKSQVHDDSEVCHRGDTGTMAITKWMAEKLGLA